MTTATVVNYPTNEIGSISQGVLGLTARQAKAMSDNGWQNLVDLEGYTTDDITSWMDTSARVALNRGGCTFPLVRQRRVCALNYWVNRRILRGMVVIWTDFTVDEMNQALVNYPIHDLGRDTDDAVDKPETFSYDKWVDWQVSVITYLKAKKNISKNVPLYYIIRPDTQPVGTMSEEEEIVFNAAHNGAAFERDNTTVH